MNLVQRVAAAVALAAAAATGGATYVAPEAVERAAIFAGMSILTPEMEGTEYRAYRDQGGVWTICTGHTGGVRQGDRASPQECAAYFEGDTWQVIAFIWQRLRGGGVGLVCKVAIGDFAYNVGTGALGRSTLLKRAAAGDQRGVAAEFMRWTFVDGKDCKDPGNKCSGIVKRRDLQRQLCLWGLE